MRKMRNPVIFCIFLMLGACALPPRNTGTAYMFALLPATGTQPAKPAPGHLGVAFPVTSPELDTARIALRRGDGDWDYYAGARWADFLPVMVQDNIVKSIENTRIFASVTPDAGPSSDRVLKIEIRHFEADYRRAGDAPMVRVSLEFTVLDHRRTQVLVHFTAEKTARAARDSLSAVQSAFQKAFSEAEKQGISALAAKPE